MVPLALFSLSTYPSDHADAKNGADELQEVLLDELAVGSETVR